MRSPHQATESGTLSTIDKLRSINGSYLSLLRSLNEALLQAQWGIGRVDNSLTAAAVKG